MPDARRAAVVEARIIRMRLDLDQPPQPPVFPSGIAITGFRPDMASALETLLVDAFRNQANDRLDDADWYVKVSADPEFDPDLVFVAVDEDQRIAGLCHCWTSDYIKDLAVRHTLRRKGLGGALVLTAAHAFRLRGASAVELKTTSDNPCDASSFYRSLGFVEVPL